jgi:hypothetical protein
MLVPIPDPWRDGPILVAGPQSGLIGIGSYRGDACAALASRTQRQLTIGDMTHIATIVPLGRNQVQVVAQENDFPPRA